MKNQSFVFELDSENLSNLGGPMGTDSTYSNWNRLFWDKEKAKKFAEADYVKNNGLEEINWSNDRSGGCSSQDLGYVMYNIRKMRVV